MRDRTPIAIRTDNLIRQRLRIGDPNRPDEVAEGLGGTSQRPRSCWPPKRWAGRSAPIAYGTAVTRAPESLATGAELRQATDDFERDIAAPSGIIG